MRLLGRPSAWRYLATRCAPDEDRVVLHRLRVLSWIEECRARGVTRDHACKMIGISASTYTRWSGALRLHGARGLKPRSSRPVSSRDPWKRREVREHVERLRLKHPCGKEKLAVMLAAQGIEVSASTVGRVLSELRARGVIEPIGARRRHSKRRRAAVRYARRRRQHEHATRPGELIQIDTLHEYSNLTRRLHFTAIDPITKFVHASLVFNATSHNAAVFLEQCMRVWPHPIRSVQVDNGSEFMGAFERVCAKHGIELVTIPPGTPKANAQVERMQRTFREEHYAHEPPHLNLADANAHLQAYLEFYLRERPHKALGMRTPIEYARTWNPSTGQT